MITYGLTCSPVGETVVDAVTWELFGASCCEDEVALQTGVYDLGDDVLVCEADDKAVLWCIAVIASDAVHRLEQELLCTHYLFLAWVTSLLRA